MENFGHNLKKIRLANGWNQMIVGNLLNISLPAYSKIETSATIPNITRVKQLAVVFNVSIKILLEGDSKTEDIAVKIALENKLAEHEEYLVVLKTQFIALYEELHQVEIVAT